MEGITALLGVIAAAVGVVTGIFGVFTYFRESRRRKLLPQWISFILSWNPIGAVHWQKTPRVLCSLRAMSLSCAALREALTVPGSGICCNMFPPCWLALRSI